MKQYAILRLLLAAFLLYFAWPYIPEAITQLELLFWGGMVYFFLACNRCKSCSNFTNDRDSGYGTEKNWTAGTV